MKKMTIFLCFIFFSCISIPYEKDVGFLCAALQNSPELPVFINIEGQPQKICRDLDGIDGGCFKRVKQGQNLIFTSLKANYSSRVKILCSKLNLEVVFDQQKDEAIPYVLDHTLFDESGSFTCEFWVYPNDREEDIRAYAHIRAVVVGEKYKAREEIMRVMYNDKNRLILGQNARTSWCKNKKGEIVMFKEKTVIKDEGYVGCVSESYNMRYNSYGEIQE